MKTFLALIVIGVMTHISSDLMKQKTKVVKLEQVPGEFKTKELKLAAGRPYVFEVKNDGVDHEVGFVITPKGKEQDQNSHVTESYLSKTIKNGEKAESGTVTLTKGEYVYFCPLNPTPSYTLIVE
ncbi:cupredoxin domain-containing protein [Marinoscillum pacificum]|uniref:cupredoxin domain-containing protein n=1 Tax=Marinoscillum pacificum TaxID=392723 RepID=UPI0021570E81|nr:cupredoxin domain-containing protein [Marinoscillum pacificum]